MCEIRAKLALCLYSNHFQKKLLYCIIVTLKLQTRHIYKWKKKEVTFWKKKVSNFQIFSKSPNMRVYHPKNTFWWYYWAYMSYIQLLRRKIFCRRGVRGAHTEKSRFQKIEVTYFFFPLWKLLTFFSTCRYFSCNSEFYILNSNFER